MILKRYINQQVLLSYLPISIFSSGRRDIYVGVWRNKDGDGRPLFLEVSFSSSVDRLQTHRRRRGPRRGERRTRDPHWPGPFALDVLINTERRTSLGVTEKSSH